MPTPKINNCRTSGPGATGTGTMAAGHISYYDDEFPLLEGNGLYASQTSGDGDCLFHSLSDQVCDPFFLFSLWLSILSVCLVTYTSIYICVCVCLDLQIFPDEIYLAQNTLLTQSEAVCIRIPLVCCFPFLWNKGGPSSK